MNDLFDKFYLFVVIEMKSNKICIIYKFYFHGEPILDNVKVNTYFWI